MRVEVGDWAELWGASVPVEDIGERGAIPLPTPLFVVLARESIVSTRDRPNNEKAKDRLRVW